MRKYPPRGWAWIALGSFNLGASIIPPFDWTAGFALGLAVMCYGIGLIDLYDDWKKRRDENDAS